MAEIRVQRRCSRCLGTGTDSDNQPPGSCTVCGGDGWLDHDKINFTDLLLPTNVFHSHIVWEATDTTEYQALSDALEASYNKIVHMGTIDLNVGSNSRIVLWSLFDAQSTTRAAFLALLQ